MREKNKTLEGGVVKALRLSIASAMLFLCSFGSAFAAEGDAGANTGGGTDPVKLIGNFNSWLLSIFSALGVTIVIYGIYQIVTTWTSHDMMQRINSILIIVGGAALIGISSVLSVLQGQIVRDECQAYIQLKVAPGVEKHHWPPLKYIK